jgi:hypothetical protein
MVTTTTSRATNVIEKEFDSFQIDYESIDLSAPTPRNTGTECWATITCLAKSSDLAGVINFYEHQPPPVNSYGGSHPHIIINFHISRFNDVINLLRNQRTLFLWFDFNRLEGGLSTEEPEPIGRRE